MTSPKTGRASSKRSSIIRWLKSESFSFDNHAYAKLERSILDGEAEIADEIFEDVLNEGNRTLNPFYIENLISFSDRFASGPYAIQGRKALSVIIGGTFEKPGNHYVVVAEDVSQIEESIRKNLKKGSEVRVLRIVGDADFRTDYPVSAEALGEGITSIFSHLYESECEFDELNFLSQTGNTEETRPENVYFCVSISVPEKDTIDFREVEGVLDATFSGNKRFDIPYVIDGERFSGTFAPSFHGKHVEALVDFAYGPHVNSFTEELLSLNLPRGTYEVYFENDCDDLVVRIGDDKETGILFRYDGVAHPGLLANRLRNVVRNCNTL